MKGPKVGKPRVLELNEEKWPDLRMGWEVGTRALGPY